MKQANNNEVDLLLRGLARGREASLLQSETTSAEAVASGHLDADELNAYAEGAAPNAARARYMEHLADCETCRGLVVGLTQVAGAVNRHDVVPQPGGLGFWQKLTALFSPPVLRYAVPALVLTVVIGIGLFAFRQPRQTDFVAQNQPAPSAHGDSSAAVNPTPGSLGIVPAGSPSGAIVDSTKRKDELKDQATQPVVQPTVAPDSNVAKTTPKDSTQAGEGTFATSQQTYALEPKAAAPPPPTPLADGAEKSNALAKERAAKREDRPRDQEEALRTESDDVHGPNRSRSVPQPASSAGMTAGRGPSGMDKKKAAEVETRTVMGRHFSREGDAWVDTAYQSSRATIRVSRGSEQFRALVADEPAIRTIAEQLGGVVIVVWKGRAYRIQ